MAFLVMNLRFLASDTDVLSLLAQINSSKALKIS